MKLITRFLLVLVILASVVSCKKTLRDFTRDAILEVEGEILYQDEIEDYIPKGLSANDSLYLAESYKQQWATRVLLYKIAFNNVGNSDEIKKLTQSYQKELIINQYQQQLISEKLGKVSEDSLHSYYEKNKHLFPLEETVVKGIFIQLPLTSPDQEDLIAWLSNTTDENLENIMRYCTQNAISYQFFLEAWKPYGTINALMPNKIDENSPTLTRGVVTQKNEEYCYLLRITGKCDAGNPQPYEMIQPELRNVLSNQEKIRFINQFQQELYNQALSSGRIISHQNP